MSEYINSIEKDYNDGNITLAEITKLREDFNKLSAYDKKTLDIKYGKKEADSKNNKPQPKISNEEKVIMSENPKNYHKLRGRAYLYSFLGFCVIVMYTAVTEVPSPIRELIILLVTGGIYNYLKPDDKDKPKGDKWA